MNAVLSRVASEHYLCQATVDPAGSEFSDYKVADMSLAAMGPQGNRHCRNRDARSDGNSRRICRRKALAGARIAGSLHMTIQTAVLIETLIKWARRFAGLHAIFFRLRIMPQRQLQREGTPVFAYKGESLDDYWEYTHRIFEWPATNSGSNGPT